MKKKEQNENGLVADNNPKGPRRSLRKCEKGLSTVEYIIILILIAVTGITIWSDFGELIVTKVDGAKGQVDTKVKW